jgi:hypothetical protein
MVEDKGSRNGTYVNGQRVTGRAPLRSGDRLVIANVELTFLEEADAIARATTAPLAGPGVVAFAEPAAPPTPLSSLAVAVPDASVTLIGYSADKLRALVQMLKRLGRSLDIDVTLHELLSGLFAIFPQAQRGFVAFTVEGQEEVAPRATHFHLEEANQRVALSRTLIRHVLSRREAVLWADQGPRSGSSADLRIQLERTSYLCALTRRK